MECPTARSGSAAGSAVALGDRLSAIGWTWFGMSKSGWGCRMRGGRMQGWNCVLYFPQISPRRVACGAPTP